MRPLLSTLLVSLLLGLIAFGSVYLWRKHRIDDHHSHLTAFEWFCAEFDVAGERKERVEALHSAYFPECEDHCIHYADTLKTLADINEDPGLDRSDRHVEAARQLTELEKEADKKFIDFIYAVAQELEPEASERYLRRMKVWLSRSERLAGD